MTPVLRAGIALAAVVAFASPAPSAAQPTARPHIPAHTAAEARGDSAGAPAGRPTLLVPPHADADSIVEAPPSPLLVPGAPPPPDTSAQSRARRAREYVSAGRDLEARHQLASAVSSYRLALAYDRDVPEAAYRLGALYARLGDDKEAATQLSVELSHHPENTEAGRLLGQVLARSGETGRAVAQLELLTRRDPRDAASWASLGFAYQAAQRPQDAEAALRRALRLEPKRADAQRDLGVVLAAQGRTAEARAAYARAAGLAPRDPAVPYNVGNLERRLKRPDAALAAYRRAEALDSTFAFAMQAQAQVLLETDRAIEAGEVYRRWLRVKPDDHNARLDAIRLYERLGRHDMALELGRNGVRNEPRSSDTNLIYGMALASSGQTREAVASMRRAIELAKTPQDRGRAEALIAVMRHGAPDSLRTFFEADSLAHPVRAPKRRVP